ncbi:MAG: hypothetical protein AAF800_00315 [Planctomycetota bacterium]
MKLSRQRKGLLAVASAAGLLVLADQVLLGGTAGKPTSASAAAPVAAAEAPTAAAPVPATAVAATVPTTTPSLADRLAHAGRHLPDATPDAFRPGPRWRAAEPAAEAPRPGRGFDPQAFLQEHRLEAVTRGDGQATAMISGRPMPLGTVRRGMTLRQINERGVVWAGHGVRLHDRLDPDR